MPVRNERARRLVLDERTTTEDARLTRGAVHRGLCHATGTVTPAAEAGLYRAEEAVKGVGYVGGWIVLANGDQRGAVRITDGTSNTVRGSTLYTTVSTSGMESITAEPVDGFVAQGVGIWWRLGQRQSSRAACAHRFGAQVR